MAATIRKLTITEVTFCYHIEANHDDGETIETELSVSAQWRSFSAECSDVMFFPVTNSGDENSTLAAPEFKRLRAAALNMLNDRLAGQYEQLQTLTIAPSPYKLKACDVLVLRCYEWFDRTYGNTYTSGQLELNDKLIATMPFSGCTDVHCAFLANKWLVANGYAPATCKQLWQTQEQLGVLIVTSCDKAKKTVTREHGRARTGIPTF